MVGRRDPIWTGLDQNKREAALQGLTSGGRWGRGGRLKMDERVGEGERELGGGRGGDLDDRARKVAVADARTGSMESPKGGERAGSGLLAHRLKLKLYPVPAFLFLFQSYFSSATVCLFGLNIHVIPPPFLHSSLPIPPLHTLMSPAALQQQHAAVLHGPKDLRVDSRTLWPPQQGQAQVAVVSTGLCGSDCTCSPPSATPTFSHAPSTQYTITSTAVTVILPSSHP
jgi:hypothetical protein